jgi:hypothetical protein
MKLLRAHGLGPALGAALVAASLMLSGCGTDMKNPEAVAKAFMEAYKKQDPAGMLALMSKGDYGNREILEAAVKEGPSGEAHKEVFNPEMMGIMAGKNAKVEGPRYDAEGRPVFKVAQDADDAYTITLVQANGAWSIEELGQSTNAEFQAMPAKGPGA